VTPVLTDRLSRLIAERESVLSGFLEAEQERIARACHDMARAFARGGTLIALGTGSATTDAAHVAVEFMHPVIVGKRALPALAPSNDPTGFATLARLARPDDIALVLAHGPGDDAASGLLAEAARRGMLTIAMTGRGTVLPADYPFVVASDDPYVVQEVQETTYHVLWELVHVFFEHPGLLADACITCGDVAVEARVVALTAPPRDPAKPGQPVVGSAVVEKDGAREEVAVELVDELRVGDGVLCHAGVALEKVPDEPTGFLYPFLESEEHDLDAVLADVRASTVRKGADVIGLRAATDVDAVARCAADVRARLEQGGRLIAFGNGGSSTDAQDVVGDCLERGWPAVALTNDAATVTAVGNDVGFDKVFARQLIPLARAADVALAISTSGSSANVVAGLEEAHRRQMLTCAITGYDGGRLAELEWLDHLFVVQGDYIPRLQEAHATIYHLLLDAIGDRP
jgi:D-sedoheptulose 7-phosphate isomerase